MKILGTDFVTYYVSDFRTAVMFYRDVLGLPLELCSDEDQWAEFNCGNLTLTLKGGTEVFPGDHAPRVALAVDNIAAAYAELKAKGAHLVGQPQDHGVCQSLQVLDPDDNVVLLHHRAGACSG